MDGTQVASLFGVLGLDDSGFNSGIKGAKGQLGSFAGDLSSFGKSITGVGTSLALATAPLTAFFATSIKQFSDQQTQMSQLQAVIKSTGGAAGVTSQMALGLADSFAKVTRYSDDAILSGENMLLTFTNIGKDVFPDATKTVLDMSQALGQDLKSSAIQLGKALNDPIHGVTALQRVGVTFTEAQKDQIKAMVESGNTMGAQKVILQELGREFGNSATAAGTTFAGQMDILNHRFEEFQEKIGGMLMPLLQSFAGTVGTVIDSVAAWVDQNPQLAQTILTVLAGVTALAPVLIIVGQTISAIGTVVGLVAPLLAALSPPVLAIIAAFAALKLAYDNNFLGFKDFVDGLVDKIGYLTRALPVYLNTVVFYFGYYFKQIWDTVGPLLQPVINWFTGTGSDSFSGAVTTAYNTVIKPVIDLFVKLLGDIWSNVSTSLTTLASWFTTTGLPDVKKYLDEQIIPKINDLVHAIATIWTLVEPFVNLFVTNMKDKFGGFVTNVIEPVISKLSIMTEMLSKLGVFTGNPLMGLGFAAVSAGAAAGGFPARAGGGPVTGGQPYIVGERGPEVFMPSSSGTIIPNRQMAGGTTIHWTGDVVLGDIGQRSDDDVRTMFKQVLRDLATNAGETDD